MQKLKKIRTGPVQKKLFRPAGIPAGKESSTGPDRTGPAGYRYRLQLCPVRNLEVQYETLKGSYLPTKPFF